MIHRGKFTFNTDTDYFKYVMEGYFRKIPPIPTNIYLNHEEAQVEENRIKIATHCHFPSIINTLARDPNFKVVEAALKNDFWLLVGELQDVLGFGKRERKEFARQEVFRVILVLLMFEDDIDIIVEVMRNASISTQMLTVYINLLKKRGRGQKDQQILKEAQKSLLEKKDRIIKASDIQKSRKHLTDPIHQAALLEKLADPDPVIRRAVSNILVDIKPAVLLEFVRLATNPFPADKILVQFNILTQFLRLVEKRDPLKRIPLNTLPVEDVTESEKSTQNLAEYFNDRLNRRRLLLIDQCQEDLTNFLHVQLLAHCHCDSNEEIVAIGNNILSLDDVFALASDNSTPQDVFKSILDILSEHPDETVQKRVDSTYHEESERLWNRLKELEQTINAYFDIIFQSLGFTQINEFNISIKSLEQAEKTIESLDHKLTGEVKEKIAISIPLFEEIKKAVEMQIFNINADIRPAKLKDLYHIQDIIQQIFDLKNIGKEGLRPGVMIDIDPQMLDKAQKIWQSALGQFLGRIKHLNEMIKIKFSILAKDIERHENIQSDFAEIVETFELTHKQKVSCNLEISCNQCPKRGCASERFLTETEFFIDELIDNFLEENES